MKDSSGNRAGSARGGTGGGASGGTPGSRDPYLAMLNDRWPTLPVATKMAIVRLAESASDAPM